MPGFLFQHLANLTLPDYPHQLYLDSTPVVEDAYINIGRGMGWNTIVIGGAGRRRARLLCGLILPVPQISSRPVSASCWEFGAEDDPGAQGDAANSDLGLTFARPVIAMSNAPAGGEQKWLAVFGNGYNSTGKKGEAVIYMLFIDQGLDGVWTPDSDVIKINTQVAGVNTPNGIADVRAVDIDGNGTIDRLYAGDSARQSACGRYQQPQARPPGRRPPIGLFYSGPERLMAGSLSRLLRGRLWSVIITAKASL